MVVPSDLDPIDILCGLIQDPHNYNTHAHRPPITAERRAMIRALLLQAVDAARAEAAS